MMNAKKVSRGQIWHWQDPIYGEKAQKMDGPVGENTIRYSRYILIVQDEPRDDSVLAVPLSTKYTKNTDYRIPVWHPTYGEVFSYVKIDRVFPVYPTQLDSYICTVSTDIMNLIEAEMIRLLCPTVYKNPTIGEILIQQGLPLDQVSEDHWQDEENKPGLYNIVGKFIKRHIKTGVNILTPASEVYSAYCTWCYENGYIPPERMASFLDIFCTLLHLTKDGTGQYAYSFKNIRIEGIEVSDTGEELPKEEVKAESPKEETKAAEKLNQEEEKKKVSKKKRWSDSEQRKFLAYLESHTNKEAATEFGISVNLVYRYKKKFLMELSNDSKEISETENSDEEETVSEETTAWSSFGAIMKSIRETLSSVSNYMKDDLQLSEVYTYTAKDPIARTAEYVEKDEFYRQISAGIYYSLTEYLEIKEGKVSKTFYHAAPATLVQSKQYLAIANIAKWADEGLSPYQIRNKIKSGKNGIDKLWLNYLNEQLSFRLNLSPENIANIVAMVGNNYCS